MRPFAHLSRNALLLGLNLTPIAAAMAQQTTAPASVDSQASATTLDSVTVTSRQRAERLQDVPIAITAFNAQDIRRAGIHRASDFINLTSNINLTESYSMGSSFISIRGITQQRNEESPVTVVVDGIPQVSTNQLTQELFDVDQIEVLKGPQSALYGNNAIGGAINITTVAPPSDQSTGYLQAGVGNGDTRRIQGSYGGPLTKDGHLRYQASAYWNDTDGLIRNVYLDNHIDRRLSNGARIRLIDDINDWITVDVHASNSYDTGHGIAWIYQPLFGFDDASNASAPITANNSGTNTRTLSQLAARADFRFSAGTLTTTTAWDRVREASDGDSWPYSPGTSVDPLPGYDAEGTVHNYLDISALSQEIRFTSSADQRLRWIAGVYGQWQDRYVAGAQGLDLGQGIVSIHRVPNAADSRNPTTSMWASDDDNRTYSAFGQLAYDLTPQWEASLALRYSRYEREQTNRAPAQFDDTTGLVRDASFDAWQPKVSLTWKPSARVSAYATYGKGFNSGGWNAIGITETAAAAGVNGVVSELYRPATANSYEAGIKTRPRDWLELNADAFYTEVENQHFYTWVPVINASIITSIDKVQLRGVELEGKAALGSHVQLIASYGYTDSEIKRYALDPSVVGNQSPYIPRYTGNFSAQFSHAIGEGLNGTLRADYRRLGPQYWDPDLTSQRDAINLVNARYIIDAVSGDWSVTFWGRNLGNTAYLSEYVLGGYGYMAPPRSYGVDFRWNFR